MPTDVQPASADVSPKVAFELKPATRPMPLRRRLRLTTLRLRELASIAWALLHTSHPYMAQIVPMRRCNLACTYCNEYDNFSDPVPLAEMERRIDELGRLGTSVITISGGEPTLHPDLDAIIARIRRTGAIAGMITNGYNLNRERIERLNRAGLDHLQISIDNVLPDDVSKKSLKVLDQRLIWLAEYADFHVNINSVVGGGIPNPQDAYTVSTRALDLGFSSTIGIIHDGSGQLKRLGGEERTVWERVRQLTRRSYSRFNHFQEAIANGMPNDWRCRAGARYLYIAEDGLVHLCSQQRGYPGTPVADYTVSDIRREYRSEKGCAPNCTISCVHQVSYIDHWRGAQTPHPPRPAAPTPAGHGDLVQIG